MSMKTREHGNTLLTGAWLGGLTSLPVMGLSFLGQQLLGLPFIPFELFDWIARVLPGAVITAGIDLLVSAIGALGLGPTDVVAKTAEQLSALGLVLLLGAIFGFGLALLARGRPDRLTRYGLIGGALIATVWIVASASLGFEPASGIAVLLWLGALGVAWGAALGWLIQRARAGFAEQQVPGLSRRGFVTVVGGSAVGISLGAWGLGTLISREVDQPVAVGDDGQGTPQPLEDLPTPAEPVGRIEPAPGTRPELSPEGEFYRIDINTQRPQLDGQSWRLELGGLVDNPLSLSLDEIRAMPSVTQTITLSCISNRIAGDLIGTAHWTGVKVKDILELAGVRPEGMELAIESADGFYESVAMEDLMDDRTLLVYAMNGLPLPREHGFPLRIYIPNRYGMKQPKWIERMEVIDHEGAGYWVERGWSEEAYVRTTSVIDSVAADALQSDAQTVPVGGIAYAGARGISKVEVQVDEGPWIEAELRRPPLSDLTWVQWRLDWPYQAGRHTFRVRAYDGLGEMQILTPSGVRPDGATGVHELIVNL